MRGLVAALLLANLLFFAWARGWLAPTWQAPRHGEREPERVAAQVRPDSITVVSANAANAVVAAARAAGLTCLDAGPFNDSDLAAAENLLASANLPPGSWTRHSVQPPTPWLVYLGRFADAAARRAREAELRKFDLAVEAVGAPPDLAPGLALSVHDSRAAAEAALAALPASAATATRGVRIVSGPTPPAQRWLRATQADNEMQSKLETLPAAVLAGGFKPCAEAPR